MAKKLKTYWQPDAKSHLAAAHLLAKNAPHLAHSAPVVQRKQASFRAAAKLAAKLKLPKQPKAEVMKQPPQAQMPSIAPPKTPLGTNEPPPAL